MKQKIILHIPHASTFIPDYTGYVVDDKKINYEILLLTDWYTDSLFSSDNAISVVATFNRVFCDVERFADDEHEIMAKQGMGMAYTHCDDGTFLRRVSEALKQTILKGYYIPHHQSLTEAVDEQLRHYNKAVIIDCHSFSDEPFRRDLSQVVPRADICIGTDNFHTPEALKELTEDYFSMHGMSVGINSPYSGTIVPIKLYQKDYRVISIMLEINRKLYLRKYSNDTISHYKQIKTIISNYLRLLNDNINKFNVIVRPMN